MLTDCVAPNPLVSVDDSVQVVFTGRLLKFQLRAIGLPSYVPPGPAAPDELSVSCPAEYTL
jgi:hypothetical protein